MKRRNIALVAILVAMVLCAGISPAWSYFTDRSMATGGMKISVKPTTTIEENYHERVKDVVITNSSASDVDVFVRARVYASIAPTISGDGWSGPFDDEGNATSDATAWYYYGSPDNLTLVAPGDQTTTLKVALEFPENATEDDEFNVIVVYESTPVQYREDGTPYADWSYILDEGTAEGGN